MKIRTQITLSLVLVLVLITAMIGAIVIKKTSEERKTYLQDLQLSYLVTLSQSYNDKINQFKQSIDFGNIDGAILKQFDAKSLELVQLFARPQHQNEFNLKPDDQSFGLIFEKELQYTNVSFKSSFFKILYHSSAFEVFLWDGRSLMALADTKRDSTALKNFLSKSDMNNILPMSREFKEGDESFLLSIHQAVGQSNLYLVSYMSNVHLSALVKETVTKLAPYFIGILILLLLFSSFLSKRITGPVLKLVELSSRISEGNWSDKIETSNSKNEVNQLALSFNTMSDELEKREKLIKEQERLSVLGQFSAGIAHEIKNPLNVISSYAQLLIKKKPEGLDEQSIKYLNIIHSEVRRGSQIITDLMVYAKERELQKQKFSYLSFLGKLRENFSMMAAVANVHLEFNNEAQISELYGDESSLFQVFTNLIENALHSFDGVENEHKQIEIITEREKEQTVIKISDNGAGIPEEHLAHLFEPFYTTKKVGKGTGLGLSTCHGIIDRHGGSIRVSSELNSGTVFIITLPNH